MFTTISTYYTFPKTIEQIRQNMTGHVTSRYQGLNSSEVGAKIENMGTRLGYRWVLIKQSHETLTQRQREAK
jgi:hypothetical protein